MENLRRGHVKILKLHSHSHSAMLVNQTSTMTMTLQKTYKVSPLIIDIFAFWSEKALGVLNDIGFINCKAFICNI